MNTSKYSSTLMFFIIFRIHCNFFIVLTTQLKTFGSNAFLYLQGKMCAPEKSGASKRLCLPESTRLASGAQFVQAWKSKYFESK